MELEVVKHPLPMKLADDKHHMYPTTIDMVFAEDGKTPIFDKQSGDWTANNALNLGGKPATDYMLKTDSPSSSTGGSGVPAGGTAGQTLVKKSETDGDAQWSDIDLSDITCEDNDVDEVGNVIGVDADTLGGKLPSEYASAESVTQLSQQKANQGGWTPNKIIGTDSDGNLVAQDQPEGGGGDAKTLGGVAAAEYARNILISDAYFDEKTYNNGDYCISENTLYKCKRDNVTGIAPTNATYWEAVTVASELGKSLKPVTYTANENKSVASYTSYSGAPISVGEDGLYLSIATCGMNTSQSDAVTPNNIYIKPFTNEGLVVMNSAGILGDKSMIDSGNQATGFAVIKARKGENIYATGYNYSANAFYAIIKLCAIKISEY